MTDGRLDGVEGSAESAMLDAMCESLGCDRAGRLEVREPVEVSGPEDDWDEIVAGFWLAR